MTKLLDPRVHLRIPPARDATGFSCIALRRQDLRSYAEAAVVVGTGFALDETGDICHRHIHCIVPEQKSLQEECEQRSTSLERRKQMKSHSLDKNEGGLERTVKHSGHLTSGLRTFCDAHETRSRCLEQGAYLSGVPSVHGLGAATLHSPRPALKLPLVRSSFTAQL